MSEPENVSDPPPEPDGGKPRKWEKPRIQSGQLFETNSLSCGKTPTDGTAPCQVQNPTNS